MENGTLEYGGNRIALDRVRGEGHSVVFLGGYASARKSIKGTALMNRALERGWEFVRFDYSGHGESTGRFEDATLGLWLEETLAVIEAGVDPGKRVILVGSSMGGWIALLAAMRLGSRVAGLVTIACGADFTEELIRPMLSAQILEKLEREGVVYRTNPDGTPPTPLAWRFLEEAKNHLLLSGPIPVECPARLFHGQEDPDVPWTISARVLKNIASADATLTLVKGGGHRLSTPTDLERLFGAIEELR